MCDPIEKVCRATCQQHTCGAGLVNDTTKDALTDPTDDKCCKQITCATTDDCPAQTECDTTEKGCKAACLTNAAAQYGDEDGRVGVGQVDVFPFVDSDFTYYACTEVDSPGHPRCGVNCDSSQWRYCDMTSSLTCQAR